MLFEESFSVENLQAIFLENIKNKSGKGIDGISCEKFDRDLAQLVGKISSKAESCSYRFSPYLEIVKSKGRGKQPRIISKPTVRDKLALSALKNILHENYPDCVQNQLPNKYIRDIKSVVSKHDIEELYYLKIDIKGFYDNLNHKILLDKCLSELDDKRVLSLVRRAIINKTVPKNYKRSNSKQYQNTVGVPQGLSISNVLAGIYMRKFDQMFENIGIKYFRYVDDILILAKETELDEIENKVESALIEIGLETNDKTEKGKFTKPFDYLGYEISSSHISVRESTIDRYITSIIAKITDFKSNYNHRVNNSKWLSADQIKELFILNLNEKITGAITEKKRYGWIFYFIEISNVHLLHKIDAIIRSQFSRLSMFENKPPKELKSLARSYYVAKYSPFNGYIHNYSSYDTTAKKIQFLVKFGYISENDSKEYTVEEIERRFEAAKMSHLVKLEEDIGNIS
ncbi:reverse transcriptase domain-containing protein [Thalassotalea euphylliae]|uniref:reverse transcriptase domain-containing protein n=1 Tax=Thalassotalea euphylliae TaxID=1655234 RepID=UPI00363387F6